MREAFKITAGLRFDRLVVLKQVERKPDDKDKHFKWLCQCDCGKTCVVRSSNLRNGITKSCGCSKLDIKDITGQRFGRLIALKHIGFASNHVALWKCKCDCGKMIVARECNLHSGITKSCGCLQIERTKKANSKHGKTNTRLYNIWSKMKERCCNPTRKAYKNYGKKGVSVCDEWLNDFQKFHDWAIVSGYKDNLTIDRINSDGNYEPNNCRWITLSENVRQKYKSDFITVGDKSLTIHDWAQRLNLSQYALRNRYKEFGKEWVEKAIKTILETGDNTHIYKRKEYANGRIRHRKNTNTQQ